MRQDHKRNYAPQLRIGVEVKEQKGQAPVGGEPFGTSLAHVTSASSSDIQTMPFRPPRYHKRCARFLSDTGTNAHTSPRAASHPMRHVSNDEHQPQPPRHPRTLQDPYIVLGNPGLQCQHDVCHDDPGEGKPYHPGLDWVHLGAARRTQTWEWKHDVDALRSYECRGAPST
ncbi:hypothetical protein DXG03_002486 [Asterophora parasitica]|uniref:Uncharacterized protein n=1 Tax=Asterophora parasitica TaxID=117018 RepID=A0A9P7KC83_9AGAR|nr:hypothetical protein DXG03_002486 [Asterophora parasitica]